MISWKKQQQVHLRKWQCYKTFSRGFFFLYLSEKGLERKEKMLQGKGKRKRRGKKRMVGMYVRDKDPGIMYCKHADRRARPTNQEAWLALRQQTCPEASKLETGFKSTTNFPSDKHKRGALWFTHLSIPMPCNVECFNHLTQPIAHSS